MRRNGDIVDYMNDVFGSWEATAACSKFDTGFTCRFCELIKLLCLAGF